MKPIILLLVFCLASCASDFSSGGRKRPQKVYGVDILSTGSCEPGPGRIGKKTDSVSIKKDSIVIKKMLDPKDSTRVKSDSIK